MKKLYIKETYAGFGMKVIEKYFLTETNSIIKEIQIYGYYGKQEEKKYEISFEDFKNFIIKEEATIIKEASEKIKNLEEILENIK
jgi:hypothetical protein